MLKKIHDICCYALTHLRKGPQRWTYNSFLSRFRPILKVCLNQKLAVEQHKHCSTYTANKSTAVPKDGYILWAIIWKYICIIHFNVDLGFAAFLQTLAPLTQIFK